jgi:phosphate/sulfate permease
VSWSLVGRIMWAWVLTIPAAGGMAYAIYWVISKF